MELASLQAKVTSCLRRGGIDPDEVDGLKNIFSKSTLTDPFQGLTSTYLRNKYIEIGSKFFIYVLSFSLSCLVMVFTGCS